MNLYETFVRPYLFKMDEEKAHDLAMKMIPFLPSREAESHGLYDHCRHGKLFGSAINNVVGLAAGFDKEGALVPHIHKLGFGFAEIGSITSQACKGNEKPRLFRLPKEESVINRMGLNSSGALNALGYLRKQLEGARIPIGINIARSNVPGTPQDGSDEISALSALGTLRDLATYFTLNISCPNTSERIRIDNLDTLFHSFKRFGKPVLVKLSPDITDEDLDSVLSMSAVSGIDGFICGNTTTQRPGMCEFRYPQKGGLSGKRLLELGLALCGRVKARKLVPKQIIIGCGGISSGADAFKYILAGANYVQIYTAMIYRGPYTAAYIAEELEKEQCQ